MKNILGWSASLLPAALLLLEPAAGLAGAREGITLWLGTMLPSLLPFMVCMALLLPMPALQRLTARWDGPGEKLLGLPGWFSGVWIAGLTGGYLAGAAALAGKGKSLSPDRLTKAALLATLPSPIFCVSAIGSGMLSSPGKGWLLWGTVVLLQSCCGLLLPVRDKIYSPPGETSVPPSLSAALGSTMATLTGAGAGIIFFGAVTGALGALLPESIRPVIQGMAEVSGGVKACLSGCGLAAGAFCLGWSGICVLTQTMGMLPGLRKGVFIGCKALCGLGAAAIVSLLPVQAEEAWLPLYTQPVMSLPALCISCALCLGLILLLGLLLALSTLAEKRAVRKRAGEPRLPVSSVSQRPRI